VAAAAAAGTPARRYLISPVTSQPHQPSRIRTPIPAFVYNERHRSDHGWRQNDMLPTLRHLRPFRLISVK